MFYGFFESEFEILTGFCYRGSFSIVKEAVNRDTSEHVALKIVEKKTLGTEEAGSLENEVMILSQIDHPNIVK